MNWKKRLNKYVWWIIYSFCGYLLLTHLINQPFHFVYLVFYPFVFYLICFINVLIHEFGHAIAGWLVGFKIPKIIIGKGKNIYKFKIKKTSTHLYINSLPFTGLTYANEFSPNNFRLKYLFFTLGGVISQVFFSIISFVYLYINYDLDMIHTNITLKHFYYASSLFIFLNILDIFNNLIPKYYKISNEYYPSDGLTFWQTIWMKKNDLDETIFADRINKGIKKIQEGKYLEAEEIYNKCLEEVPDLSLAIINLSIAYILQEKIDKAINISSELIKNLNLDNSKKKYICNTLAHGYLLKFTSDTQFLEKADSASREAYFIDPNFIYIVQIRASILIEIGEINEGVQILEKIITSKEENITDEEKNDVINFLYLAYGYYLQEKWQESRQYWLLVKDNESLKTTEYRILFQHILKQTNNFNF